MRKLNSFFLISLILFFLLQTISFAKVSTIDASKNAIYHNNVGLMYLKESNYLSAIVEFQIAIALNPNCQSTSVYYYNLGTTYFKLGRYDLAKGAFERAAKQNPMNFQYWLGLTQAYKKLNQLLYARKLCLARKKQDIYYEVFEGLILIELGYTIKGKQILMNFVKKEPNLIISQAVKKYLRHLK